MTIYELIEGFRENFPQIIRNEKTVVDILSNKNNHIIKKVSGSTGEIIGVAVINKSTVLMLYVNKRFRNRGYGKALIERCENYVKKMGYSKINFGEGFDYLMPGVPINNFTKNMFENLGYKSSWGNVECFDMMVDFLETRVDFSYNIGDTIDGITYSWATQQDINQILACTDDAEPKFSQYYRDINLYSPYNIGRKVLIANKRNQVVGTLIVEIGQEHANVGSVGCTTTKRAFQRMGIATNMVKLGTKYLQFSGVRYGYLGYTYTGLEKMYGKSGYKITNKYFMAEKEL